jgi:YD repeat-containing protein
VTNYDGSNNQSIHYGYDENGNRSEMLTRLNAVSQSLTTYDYDALNRLESVSDRDLSEPTNDALAETTSFGYNAVGLLSSIQRPNDVETRYSYDAPHDLYTEKLAQTE